MTHRVSKAEVEPGIFPGTAHCLKRTEDVSDLPYAFKSAFSSICDIFVKTLEKFVWPEPR